MKITELIEKLDAVESARYEPKNMELYVTYDSTKEGVNTINLRINKIIADRQLTASFKKIIYIDTTIMDADALPTEPTSKGGDGSSAKGREPEPEGGVGGEVMADGRTTVGAYKKGGN